MFFSILNSVMNTARKPLTTTVLGQAQVKNWLIIFHFLEFIMHIQYNTVYWSTTYAKWTPMALNQAKDATYPE